jgi:hypothetical protein
METGKHFTTQAAITIISTIFAKWNNLAERLHDSISGYILVVQDLAALFALIIGIITIVKLLKNFIRWLRK